MEKFWLVKPPVYLLGDLGFTVFIEWASSAIGSSKHNPVHAACGV
jgi:hypothetical protein